MKTSMVTPYVGHAVNYTSDEFWICCDICEKWFHEKFVV
uniref:Uncharacterized protein n=1 Tax=Cucumis melo TaxID=3656 RepID=A0A9I9E0W4_CUCME